jgi:hypothetical protein
MTAKADLLPLTRRRNLGLCRHSRAERKRQQSTPLRIVAWLELMRPVRR